MFEPYYQHLWYLLKARCTKDPYGKHPQYVGLRFLSREEYQALLKSTEPLRRILFDIWKESGYQRRLSPTIDRMDSAKGYIRGNIRFVHHYHNSAKLKPYAEMSAKFL